MGVGRLRVTCTVNELLRSLQFVVSTLAVQLRWPGCRVIDALFAVAKNGIAAAAELQLSCRAICN